MIELIAPAKNATVSLQTEAQKEFIEQGNRRERDEYKLLLPWYEKIKRDVDCSIPMPVSFSWREVEKDSDDAYYFLMVSESEDMKNPWTYITKDTDYDVYNLKVGKKYFWCVQKNGERSEISSFETLLTLPRWMKIDCISNVRDIGGYKVDGGRIREGLVFRGGEMERNLHLTPAGAEELFRLGIRTDLDLRTTGKSRYGSSEALGIKRINVPCGVNYDAVFREDKLTISKKFYRVFANPKNYPIYFHCAGGADRTGTFAFILGAFLGMSYDDLINEYELTSLSTYGIRMRYGDQFPLLMEKFMALEGDTLREKATTFLRDYAGLTDRQMENIYNILVEKE